jgi:hypothetical protein
VVIAGLGPAIPLRDAWRLPHRDGRDEPDHDKIEAMPTLTNSAPASIWYEAERQGVIRGSAQDIRDGFIHFSTAGQVTEAAWEETDLGKRYKLIEEDGEPVSQQYPSEVGSIDLLVRDKKTRIT